MEICLSELLPLKQMFETNGTEVSVREDLGRVFISGDNCELMLRVGYPRNTITIARIETPNKRQGLGTEILDWLKIYATSNDFTCIRIENTLTTAIQNFAIKHGFTKLPDTGFEMDGVFIGCWEFELTK